MLLESLRTHLLTAGLKIQTDRIHVFTDNAKTLYNTAPGRLGWRRNYTGTVIIEEFPSLNEPLLDFQLMRWLDQHQPERSDDVAYQSTIDILRHDAIDVEFILELTERYTVSETENGTEIKFCPELVPEGIESPSGPLAIAPIHNASSPPVIRLLDFSPDGTIAYWGTAPAGSQITDSTWSIERMVITLPDGDLNAPPMYPDGDDAEVHVWADRENETLDYQVLGDG